MAAQRTGGARRSRRSRAGRAVGVALAVLGALLAAAWAGQRSLVYLPDRSHPGPAAAALPGGQDVVLGTADGLSLDAWWLPPRDGCDAAVLVAHGNGGNRGGRAGLARALHEPGFGVLLLEYRGYGANPGAPTEAGLALDARAARAWLLEQGVDERRLLYLGESLGTGVVSELAVEHPPAALVLRSPMTSFAAVADDLYPVPLGWLLRDRYPVGEHVARVDVPVAVVLGDSDTVVRPQQSRAVAQAARDGGADVLLAEVPGAGHNDPVLAQGPALVDAVREVARRAGVDGCG